MEKKLREIDTIFIHCSASDIPEQMNIEAVTELHTASKKKKIIWGEYHTFGKEFSRIGYHTLILPNGELEQGRPWTMMGAGVRGHNYRSLHICMHGVKNFTQEQYISLNMVLDEMVSEFKIPVDNIKGHCEVDSSKSCPGFDMSLFRDAYRIRKNVEIVIEHPPTIDEKLGQ